MMYLLSPGKMTLSQIQGTRYLLDMDPTPPTPQKNSYGKERLDFPVM